VDQVTPAKPVGGNAAGASAGSGNGIADPAAARDAARDALARDLEQLTVEVRTQMGQTVDKTVWKVGATLAAVVAGIVTRQGLTAIWKAARKSDPPTNPANPGTQWSEAIAWTIASGIAVGVGRLLATRGAAAGWRRYTGALPPGLEDVSA